MSLLPFSCIHEFQPTLPRRERHVRQAFNYVHLYFNPHSHEGSDLSPPAKDSTLKKFQPTLPRRERQYQTVVMYMDDFISTHTPTKGATAILTNNFLIFCSISLIISILYLKIIQILFLFRYKFNFLSHILSANLLLFLCLLYTRITIKSMADQLVFLYLHQNVLL